MYASKITAAEAWITEHTQCKQTTIIVGAMSVSKIIAVIALTSMLMIGDVFVNEIITVTILTSMLMIGAVSVSEIIAVYWCCVCE